jgi:hypothetical protein
VSVVRDYPPYCLKKEGIIKCKDLPRRKMYRPAFHFKSNSKLTYQLCSTCDETTFYQGDYTHSDMESCIFETWVVDKVSESF